MSVRILLVLLLAMFAALASGPYTPPKIDPQRDEMYNTGKAIFWGEVKLGSGMTCGECHAKKDTLTRSRLQKIRFDLQGKISNCVGASDRVHGNVDSKQMEALVHYLAKRYRL